MAWPLNLDKSILSYATYSKLSKILNFQLHLQSAGITAGFRSTRSVSTTASSLRNLLGQNKFLSGDAQLFLHCWEGTLISDIFRYFAASEVKQDQSSSKSLAQSYIFEPTDDQDARPGLSNPNC